MAALHRHQLVRLSAAGWHALLGQPRDDEARACVRHWAERRLPLVVTRQADGHDAAAALAVGLAAPACWSRRRLALQVRHADVEVFDEFPLLDEGALATALAALRAPARIYGSHGWQRLTGLPYVHPRSDLDLWIAVADAAHADAVAAVLQGAAAPQRLDGELLFPDGRAVAWREWQAWRAGRARALLVKTLAGAALVATC